MTLFRNTMWRATTKQSFQRTSSCGYRKSWYAGEWSKPVPMAKSAPTAATTALHRLSFAANAVKCSAEFTGTIAAVNPSSGAASVDWSQPDRNATQELSMRRYWKMWQFRQSTRSLAISQPKSIHSTQFLPQHYGCYS